MPKLPGRTLCSIYTLMCHMCCLGRPPGLFLLNPDGELVIIDYSNSPFARPDLRILIEGGYPNVCNANIILQA